MFEIVKPNGAERCTEDEILYGNDCDCFWIGKYLSEGSGSTYNH